MKIYILSNDYSNNAYKTEHGLSLFIKFNNFKLLIDSGLSELFIENAERVGVNVSDADAIFLTHGHYDHTRGLPVFDFQGQSIFTHEDAFVRRYKLKDENYEYIGIEWNQNYLNNNPQIKTNTKMTQIFKNIYLSGTVPHKYPIPKNNYFIKNADGNYEPDKLTDEQLLIFDDDDGLVVVSACTHYGVDNMTAFIKDNFKDKKVKALFAGLHLSKESDEFIDKTIKQLKNAGIYEAVYPLHCTGEKAGKLIAKNFNGFMPSVGDVIDIK